MDDFYFSVELDDSRTLCLAPISDRVAQLAGVDLDGPDHGYFLFESKRGGDVSIIARAASYEAALVMRDMFKMS